MYLEQEASQQECNVSAQGFVWPQQNPPTHIHIHIHPTTLPSRLCCPPCTYARALMVIRIPPGGGGYTLPSHLPFAALTGSSVPRARTGLHHPEGSVALHDYLCSVFHPDSAEEESSPFDLMPEGMGGAAQPPLTAHFRGEQLSGVPETWWPEQSHSSG